MARPLRIERPGGRYHATARGNERKALFWGEADRFGFKPEHYPFQLTNPPALCVFGSECHTPPPLVSLKYHQ